MAELNEILTDQDYIHIAALVNMSIALPDSLFEKFYNHFLNAGEMPYGTAKARTGDPQEWVEDRVYEMYKEEFEYS